MNKSADKLSIYISSGFGYFRSRSLQRRSVRKSASIGGSKILDCEVEFPPPGIKHIIQWHKDGIEVPIFIQFDDYPPHVDTGYQGRVELVQPASIELTDIRLEDEGWYECKIVIVENEESSNNNGSWVYLAVNCK